jgi:transposase-like protein
MPSRKETIKARRAHLKGQRKTNLQDPIYHDDDAARAHLETLLWPNGPVCPRCGVTEDRITKLQGKSTRPGVYKCKDCRKPFSVTVGTVMERSHVPLHKWILAAHFMSSSKKGMSALQLQRLLGTNYETAWFLFHRLRECPKGAFAGPLGGEGKVIEADEVYLGGKEGNKHAKDRLPLDVAMDRKMKVVALVERDGRVRSHHVANVTSKTLRAALVTSADRASRLMTDGHKGYVGVGGEFAQHLSVDHSAGEYVRGDAHSNTVESYFAILKRGIYGSFHNISEAHLHRYLVEFDYRYSTRKWSDVERAEELLRGAKGKRLMYRQPNEAPHA